MGLRYSIYLIFIGTLFSVRTAFSQQVIAPLMGEVKGMVKDSVLNYGLPSATLAIYKIKDSELLGYRLSNNQGQFQFNNIPVGIPLYIVFTYVGYKRVSKNFFIDERTKKIDLQNINVEKNTDTLEDVEIKSVAPVRMNGDTLEFNADAFKLDANAVTEDLLRKLPGVIVWGDGTITVNGKEIRSLLVNGKPFFGGDTKVSTQNIPKDAIDKVQVYQVERDITKPRDTTTEVNLKLKKTKNSGYFGKFEFGYGSDKRYELNGGINVFTPRTQIGIVSALNNVNKIANDINMLLRSNTFKGGGANLEYQPNFQASGITRSNIGGFTFQRDFDPEPNTEKKNLLTSNYFINNTNNFLNSIVLTQTTLGNNITQYSQSNVNNNTDRTGQDFITKYEKKKGNYQYNFTLGANTENKEERKRQIDTISNNLIGLQSFRRLISSSSIESKNINFKTIFNHTKSVESNSRKPGNWTIDYSLDIGKENNTNANETIFNSFLNQNENKYFKRENERTENYITHNFNGKFGDLASLLFGKNGIYVNGISIELENKMFLNSTSIDKNVYDIASGVRIANQELTSLQKKTVFDDRPSVNLSKSFTDILANRYQKNLLLTLNLRSQLYVINNKSNHLFQNFNRSYQKFIPELNFSYSNYQSSEFLEKWDLSYKSFYKYPTPEQLYPIVDNSNIYNIQIGNSVLKPSNTHEVVVGFSHNSFRSKNTFNYFLKANTGIVRNYFAYLINTSEDGRSTYSYINADSYRYLNFSGALNKALKMAENIIQLKLKAAIDFARVPGYTQNFDQTAKQLNLSNNLNTNLSLQIFYSYKNILSLNLIEDFSNFQSKQTGIQQTVLTNALQSTICSINANLTKKWSLGSNVSFNKSTFTTAPSNQFTILNANTAVRFLKGNNLEAKFSALDLLKQNKSIVNYGMNNILKQSQSNVLQQYIMLSVSYYPRQFGKNEKTK